MTSRYMHPRSPEWATLLQQVRGRVLEHPALGETYPGISGEGRGAMFGSDDLFRDGVWDVLKFTRTHTEGPHFTLAAGNEWFQALMVLPDRIRTPKQRLGAFIQQRRADFLKALDSAQRDVPPGSAGFRGVAQPTLFLLGKQRHFHAQRCGRLDGLLTFKVDTLLEEAQKREPQVKTLGLWLDLLIGLLSARKANVEMQVVWTWAWDREAPDPEQLAADAVKALVALQPVWSLMNLALLEV